MVKYTLFYLLIPKPICILFMCALLFVSANARAFIVSFEFNATLKNATYLPSMSGLLGQSGTGRITYDSNQATSTGGSYEFSSPHAEFNFEFGGMILKAGSKQDESTTDDMTISIRNNEVVIVGYPKGDSVNYWGDNINQKIDDYNLRMVISLFDSTSSALEDTSMPSDPPKLSDFDIISLQIQKEVAPGTWTSGLSFSVNSVKWAIPKPSIEAVVSTSPETPLSLKLSMDSGIHEGNNYDWGLVYLDPDNQWYSFTMQGWEHGIVPALISQPLYSFKDFEILVDRRDFLPGKYLFCFGVDSKPNGELLRDLAQLYYDCVEVYFEQEASYSLPDTGQTQSYTDVFGEDSDYTINPPSYTDNGNGTVTDNVTSLIWQQGDNGTSGDWQVAINYCDALSLARCVRGHQEYLKGNFIDNGNSTVTNADTGFMWQKEDDGKRRSWADAISYCEGSHLAGYTDWRLPNVKELESLSDVKRYSPAIDTSYFPNTKSSDYWSSTTYLPTYTDAVWSVRFDFGMVHAGNHKTNTVYPVAYCYVRCVRGGQ